MMEEQRDDIATPGENRRRAYALLETLEAVRAEALQGDPPEAINTIEALTAGSAEMEPAARVAQAAEIIGDLEAEWLEGYLERRSRAPSLSIIIPHTSTWNQCTRACLDSILNAGATSYEIILVDNGSEDETLEEVAKLQGAINPEDPDLAPTLRLLPLGENRGFAVASNRGAEMAIGRHICFLNSDTIVSDSWDHDLITALSRRGPEGQKIAAVGPMSNYTKEAQLDPEARYDTAKGFLEHVIRRRERFQDRLSFVRFLSGFCLCVNPEAWEKIGHFEESFGLGYYEDDEWSERALDSGYLLAVTLGTYIHHEGQITVRALGLDYGEMIRENRRRIMQMNRDKRPNSGASDSEEAARRSSPPSTE